MYRICVLISTYNGVRYLTQQLDSILSQKGVELHGVIRDDGSTDGTIELLESFAATNANFKLVIGANIGYQSSFMELVYNAETYDYYAFADQDDIWDSDKLLNAINQLKENKEPALYFSNCQLVTANLEKMGMLHPSNTVTIPEQEMAIIQGFAHGCTMVFNAASMDLIKQYRPKLTVAHDFWIPLLHVYMGVLRYDSSSHILYRQHSNNVFGAKKSLKTMLQAKIRQFKSQPYFYSKVISELLTGYNLILKPDLKIRLQNILLSNSRFLGRTRLCFNPFLRRNTLRGSLFLKVYILLGKF